MLLQVLAYYPISWIMRRIWHDDHALSQCGPVPSRLSRIILGASVKSIWVMCTVRGSAGNNIFLHRTVAQNGTHWLYFKMSIGRIRLVIELR